jgi:glucose-6-phosphate 1-dehydrogenase
MAVEESELELAKGRPQPHELLRPYERLFHDALVGEQTLFTRADGVERIWELAAPLLAHPPAPEPYVQGCWGPDAADRLTGERGWELSTRMADQSD